MLKKLAVILVGLVAVLVLVVVTRPAHLHVERSAHVAARPEVVFPFINDFHHWEKWSPWEKLDPAMQKQHSGAPQGVGAGYAWSGNDQVGVGSMRITESQAPERIVIQLDFKEPFAASNVTTFGVSPEPGGSSVTWSMEAENGFMAKAASLFMDMDGMLGKDFETGLGALRALAEAEAAKSAIFAEP